MKGIKVYTQEWTAKEYEEAVENGDAPDPTDYAGEVFDTAECAGNFGDWTDPDASPYMFGDAYVPATAVLTAYHFLTGSVTRFWAEECSDSPAEVGTGAWYSSHYVHPYTGDVEEKSAHLVGDWTIEEAREIYRLVMGK